MNEELLIQAIGVLGFLLGVGAFFSKEDKRLKYLMCLSAGVMALHFLLLNSFTGAIMAAIASVRFFLSINDKNLRMAPFFLGIYVISGVLSYHSYVDIFPTLGGIFGTVGVFYLAGIRMRFSLILASLCWLTHNIIVASVGGVLMEALFLVVNSMTIWKLSRAKNSDINESES